MLGVIGVTELHESHTSRYLGEVFVNTISEWRIKKNNVVAVTTDSRANIKKAVIDEFGEKPHLAWLAHTNN